MGRRLQVETDDCGRLLLKLRVIADHVVATPVRLQPCLSPHPGHTHMVNAERGPQLAAAPMGGTIGGLAVQSPIDDPSFEFLDAFTGGTSTVPTPESGQTLFFKAVPPHWGFVQCEDLRRSEEILTGAIPSAKDGIVIVETSWRGGRGGHLWDIVKKALETREEQKQPDDWRVVFFPWQDDPAYFDAEARPLTEETLRYFADKPGFSLGQMSWYQRAREQYGLFIKREFPTALEECFQTPIEGSHLCRDHRPTARLRSRPASGSRYFLFGSHGLGSRQSDQYRDMVFSARWRRDPRHRLR